MRSLNARTRIILCDFRDQCQTGFCRCHEAPPDGLSAHLSCILRQKTACSHGFSMIDYNYKGISWAAFLCRGGIYILPFAIMDYLPSGNKTLFLPAPPTQSFLIEYISFVHLKLPPPNLQIAVPLSQSDFSYRPQ